MAKIQFYRPIGNPRDNDRTYIIKIDGVKTVELFNGETHIIDIKEGEQRSGQKYPWTLREARQ